MSKIKMRCSQCGKSFKSTNPKQLICPECEEKARRERAAKAKGGQLPASAPAPTPRYVPPARPARPAAPASEPKRHWLDQQTGVKIAAAEPPQPARPPRLDIPEPRPSPQPAGSAAASVAARPQSSPPGQARPSRPPKQTSDGAGASAPDPRGKRPGQPKRGAGERPKARVAAPPRPKREPRQPTPPFSPTPEQVQAIEQRYLEVVAQAGEYDGIRTQIAHELGLPKAAVKKIIFALRQRQDIPSWWDLQPYHGSPEDLERIRAAYVPLLPRPAVGVHKQLAAQLDLPAGTIYQAIKVIRADMNLPQYNPPEESDLPVEAP
jgi:hypothetical protein